MPLSMQAAIRWVPISPLVLSPQTKKLPNSNQKSRERLQRRSTRSALSTGLPAGGGSASAPS
jgi:hypothetical protein